MPFLALFWGDQSGDPGIDFYAVRAFQRSAEATAWYVAEVWRDAFGDRASAGEVISFLDELAIIWIHGAKTYPLNMQNCKLFFPFQFTEDCVPGCGWMKR